MAVFTVTAIMQGNHEFMFYEGTMAIIIAVLVYMDKRVMFSHTVLCGMAIWGFVHLAGGLISVPVEWTQVGETTPVLYDVRLSPYLPKYDQIVHAFGFGISLILTHEALQAHFKDGFGLDLRQTELGHEPIACRGRVGRFADKPDHCIQVFKRGG